MKISADDIIEQENSKAVKTNKDKDDSKVVHEDNLELSELKFSERQKIKRDRIKANMEGMNKHEKKCSISPIIRATQVKTTWSSHHGSVVNESD